MARIVVISADADTRAQVFEALDREHDIQAYRSPWSIPPREQRRLNGDADLVVIDADVLFAEPVARARSASEHLGRPPEPQPQLETAVSVRARAPSVIVVVEPGEEQRIVPCFEAGADDYVVKPVDAEDLRARVERVLAQRLGIASGDAAATDPISISDDGRILTQAVEGQLDEAEDDEEVLAHLGRYEVRGVLGRGGYGVVYRARDMALQRDVALKVLPRDMHDNTEAVTRFLRESTAISRLDHPNIVKFYEMGSFQGRLYFTMELAEGATLKLIADREAPLPLARAVRYVAGIAEALAAIDSLGLVHRDVKPENVIVTRTDDVKLIDFGLVKIRDTAAITSQDDVLGTPYFMAPEYIRAPGIPDIRYDLYALGVTFFHLLSGEYPFDGKNAAHVMEKHLRCPAPRISDYQPGIPLEVERTIDRLLRKDPDERLRTPQELLTLLRPLR